MYSSVFFMCSQFERVWGGKLYRTDATCLKLLPCRVLLFVNHCVCVCSCKTIPGVHRARQWGGWPPTEEKWGWRECPAAVRRWHTHTQSGNTCGGCVHQGIHKHMHARLLAYKQSSCGNMYKASACCVNAIIPGEDFAFFLFCIASTLTSDTYLSDLSVMPSARWRKTTTTETNTLTSSSLTSDSSVCSVSFTNRCVSSRLLWAKKCDGVWRQRTSWSVAYHIHRGLMRLLINNLVTAFVDMLTHALWISSCLVMKEDGGTSEWLLLQGVLFSDWRP